MSTRTGAPAATPADQSRAFYVQEAIKAAQKAGIPPAGFVAQIQQESNFNPRAVSPAGARGIAQFMPATAAGLGVNPDDPIDALNGSARLMRRYHDKYGMWAYALIAYNAGPRWADRLKSRDIKYNDLPAETRAYLEKLAPKYGSEKVGAGIGVAIGGGQTVAGGVASAASAIPDIPGRIFDFLRSIGLRLLYVVGGILMMGLGLVVVFRTMAADTIRKAVGG